VNTRLTKPLLDLVFELTPAHEPLPILQGCLRGLSLIDCSETDIIPGMIRGTSAATSSANDSGTIGGSP
jgi:hypothetical protein